jgi:N-methylhydantoinase A
MNANGGHRRYWIGIDIGGTFTDLVAYDAELQRLIVHKTPTAASRRADSVLDGVAELTERGGFTGAEVAFIGHGTTVATNAVLTGEAPPVALLMTQGFGDVLVIRRQTRPNTFDYYADYPDPLVPRDRVFELRGRLRADGTVIDELDEGEVRKVCGQLAREELSSVAISFLHSYVDPVHEQAAAAVLERALPGTLISLSSDLVPEFREYERTSTTVLNAFVRPVVIAYLERLEIGLAGQGIKAPLVVMQSNGGVMSTSTAKRQPVALIRSGPAAGVAGAAHLAQLAGESRIITLDIGGTSADVSVFEGHAPAVVRDWDVHSFPIKWTALDIRSIGAGGGSIAWIDDGGLLKVGPQSAGAEPGPASYGRGGESPTVTDAHVVLGRIGSDSLLGGSLRIDADRAAGVFSLLARRLGVSAQAAAAGVIDIVNAAIAQEIHYICTEKGAAARDFTLLAYGGAGPLHASDVARELGIPRVLIPYRPGLLCAFGVLASAPRADFALTRLVEIAEGGDTALQVTVSTLRGRAARWINEQDIPARRVLERWKLDMRYRGQNYELAVDIDPDRLDPNELRESFHSRHNDAYGYRSPTGVIQAISMRLTITLEADHPPLAVRPPDASKLVPRQFREVHFGREVGSRKTPTYRREEMPTGIAFQGPAVVEQMDATVLVLPDQRAAIDEWGNMLLTFEDRQP